MIKRIKNKGNKGNNKTCRYILHGQAQINDWNNWNNKRTGESGSPLNVLYDEFNYDQYRFWWAFFLTSRNNVRKFN